MKSIYFIFTVLLLTNFVKAQPQLDWDKTFGDKKNQQTFAVAQASDYGIVVLATKTTGLFNKIWLIKTDNQGSSSTESELKNVLVYQPSHIAAGNSSNLGFAGISINSAYDYTNINVFKTNSLLNITSQNDLAAYGSALPTDIIFTNDNGMAVVANTSDETNSYITLFRTDNSGKKIWEISVGTDSSDWGNKVIQTSDKNFILVGHTAINENTAMIDYYIAKINSNGQKVWEKIFGGVANDIAVDIIENSNGYLMLGTTYSEGNGFGDVIIYQLDKNGNEIWHKTYGGIRNDESSQIIKDPEGGYIIGASTKSYGAGNMDFWVFKITDLGNMLWNVPFGGSGDEKLSGITATFDGGLALAGTTDSKGLGKNDVWLVKLKFSIRQRAETFVNSNISQWQQKGKYEKNEDYQKRVNYYTREQKIYELTNQFFGQIGDPIFAKDILNSKLEYDTENELFKISLTYFNPIYLPVPISEAQNFEQNFKNIKFTDMRYNLTAVDKLEIFHATLTNPSNHKTYFFDAGKPVVFNNVTIVPDFKPIDIIRGPDDNNLPVVNNELNIDKDVPLSGKSYPNRYALIIGNAHYISNGSDMVDIRYSINDAKSFRNYATKVLGVTDDNNHIYYIEDANATYIRLYIDNFAKLIQAKPTGSEFFVYYSGHGTQNDKQEAYIVPVGVKSDYIEQFAIKLSDLYNQLNPGTDKKVYVFLDACFSGGGKDGQLLINAKTGVYRPSETATVNSNLLVFAASSEKQISQEYLPMQHGLFTYYLLKTLKDSKGNINFGEWFNNSVDQLTTTALNPQNGLKSQTPQVNVNSAIKDTWKNWKVNP